MTVIERLKKDLTSKEPTAKVDDVWELLEAYISISKSHERLWKACMEVSESSIDDHYLRELCYEAMYNEQPV